MLPEADLRCRGFGRVVLRGPRTVAVHVRDVVRVDARRAQRTLDRAPGALALRVRRGRVVTVRRQAVAEDLGDDRRAVLPRGLLAQQDHHSAPLAE